jgi:hypothetical protein
MHRRAFIPSKNFLFFFKIEQTKKYYETNSNNYVGGDPDISFDRHPALVFLDIFFAYGCIFLRDLVRICK